MKDEISVKSIHLSLAIAQTSIVKTRHTKRWHHLLASSRSKQDIGQTWMQTSTTRWLRVCLSSFNNRSLWHRTLTVGEVSLFGWSPVLQIRIQLLHYIQKQHVLFIGQVQSCQTGYHPYSDTSPNGECSLRIYDPSQKRPRQWASHARWKVDAFWNTDFFLTYKTTYSYYLINMRIFLLPK